MERRAVLKILSFAGLTSFVDTTTWANLSDEKLLFNSVLNENQKLILKTILGVLIPEGAIPGAVGTKCHLILNKIITDCYSKTDQQKILLGLNNFNKQPLSNQKKTFLNLTKKEKEKALSEIDSKSKEEAIKFFGIIKNLTIETYLNSEYVQTKHYNYIQAPGKYLGCVPVKEN